MSQDRIITAFYIDNKNAYELQIKDNLSAFYKQLDCRVIDIQERRINNNYYDFIIDDEGKLKDNFICALGIKNGEILETINGAFLITKSNTKGEQTSLNKIDIELIKNAFITYPKDIILNDDLCGTNQEIKENQKILIYTI